MSDTGCQVPFSNWHFQHKVKVCGNNLIWTSTGINSLHFKKPVNELKTTTICLNYPFMLIYTGLLTWIKKYDRYCWNNFYLSYNSDLFYIVHSARYWIPHNYSLFIVLSAHQHCLTFEWAIINQFSFNIHYKLDWMN